MNKRGPIQELAARVLPTLLQTSKHFPLESSKENSNNDRSDSSFPEGWFYIKSQLNGLVIEPQSLSVNSGARIVITQQRHGIDADSQLWRYDDGFLINKASGKTLDLERTYISTIQKTYTVQRDRNENSANQKWRTRQGGCIESNAHAGFMLDIHHHITRKGRGAKVVLKREREREGSMYQRWLFETWDFVQRISSQSKGACGSFEMYADGLPKTPLGFGHAGRSGAVEQNPWKFVKHAHTQIAVKNRKPYLLEELLAGAAAYNAISTWDAKRVEQNISANNEMYRQVLRETASAEAEKIYHEHEGTGNLEETKNLAVAYAIQAYSTKHELSMRRSIESQASSMAESAVSESSRQSHANV